jgi:SAM-dependent methyltransferase
MKLSELVAFRNRLDELLVSDAIKAADHKLDILMHTVSYPHELPMVQLTQPFIPTLNNNLKEIHNAFDNFNVNIEQLKQHVRDQITEHEKHWFQESYRLFESAEECEKTDQILYGRKVTGTKSKETIESEVTLLSRLSNYANWQWPGMIIRPGLEDFIDNMVGCDPLYIIDREHDLLKPCLDRFPRLYQHRLRPYTTNDWSDGPILDKIPNNQFGVCLACNVFNFRPLEIIRRYLEEIYTKLRPGGVLLMTFNDCDRASAIVLVEQFCTSYTPGYLVRNLTQNIGFELIHTWSDGGPSVWLELRKPGQLLSNRGGQALAKIHNVFDYSDDIDFLKRKVYNNDEIRVLQEQARSLGIDKKSIKRSKPYDLSVLIMDATEKKKEEQRMIQWREIAIKNNIELSLSNWQDLVKEILEKEVREQNRKQEQNYVEHLREAAGLHNIDVTSVNWKEKIEEILRIKEEEERRRIEKERLDNLHQHAKEFNIDITKEDWENKTQQALYNKRLEDIRIAQELHEARVKQLDQEMKEELAMLRQRAMELQAGDPNLIRYGYSAEKLKNLIKQKEEENK